MSDTTPTVSAWRRFLARLWYAWGLSLCYTGNRTAERSFYESGVAAFARSIRLWPEFAPAHYRSGLIKGREMGNYRAAIIELERASRLRPEWPEPYLQRGLFHRYNNAPDEAIAELEHFISLSEQSFWRSEAERHLAQLRLERPGSDQAA